MACVPGGHEQRTICRSSPPPATSALSRAVARAARLRSPSQRASIPASGVSKPTRRTVCPRTRIVSASTTSTASAAIGSDRVGSAATVSTRAKTMVAHATMSSCSKPQHGCDLVHRCHHVLSSPVSTAQISRSIACSIGGDAWPAQTPEANTSQASCSVRNGGHLSARARCASGRAGDQPTRRVSALRRPSLRRCDRRHQPTDQRHKVCLALCSRLGKKP